MKRLVPYLFIFFVGFAAQASASRLYSDVPDDHWASTSIDWVSSQGIMTGPNGREVVFEPSGAVNRAQLATVVTRLQSVMQKRIDELELKVLQLEYELTLERQRSHQSVLSSSQSSSSY